MDPFLAAFPMSTEKELEGHWERLTSWITQKTLKRILPKGMRVDSMTSSTISDGLDIQADRRGEFINFREVNLKQSWDKNAVGSERSRWAQDKSWELLRIINSSETGGGYLQEVIYI